MKNLIKRWLGIDILENATQEHQDYIVRRNAIRQQDFEEQLKESALEARSKRFRISKEKLKEIEEDIKCPF